MLRKTALLILLLTALVTPAFSQGAVVDFLLSGVTSLSNNGAVTGGSVYCYAAGTTNPKILYTDKALTISATNPVILDTDGRAIVYGSGLYKFIVKDQYGVTLFTADNVEINSLATLLADHTDPFGSDLTQTNIAITNATIASASINDLAVLNSVVLNGISANNTRITAVATATSNTDAINKGQVDLLILEGALTVDSFTIGSTTLTATQSMLVSDTPIDATYFNIGQENVLGYATDQLILGNASTTRTMLAGMTNIRSFTPPASISTGIQGDICFDTNYIYICTDDDVWMRIASGTW